MFPISDSIPARRFPFFTLFVIVITVFVFIQQLLAPDAVAFLQAYSLIPARVDFLNLMTLAPFVTAIFLHGGFLHIISNMWFLWVFGDNVEDSLSPFFYLFLYLIAGIAGNFLQYLLMPKSSIPMLGASGAVAGVLGCYYVLYPNSKVRTLIFIFVFVTIIEVSAPLLLGYWFILQIVSGAAALPFSADQGGIAFWAHVAGFIVGIIFGAVFKKRSYV